MKAQKQIDAWLYRQVQGHAFASLVGFAGLLLLSLLVLLVTFWLIYAVLWLGFNWLVPHSHTFRLWASLGVMGLLFVANAMTDRHYLETVAFSTGSTAEEPVVVYIPFVGIGSTVNPLALDSAQSSVKLLASVLLAGPRLVVASFRLLGRAHRVSSGNLNAAGAVLALLASKDGRVPVADVVAVLPRGHDVAPAFKLLQEINAVMLLKSEPVGATLLPDARDQLRRLVRGRKRQRAVPDHEEAAES